MPDQRLRPEVDVVDCSGSTLKIIDPGGILAAAADGTVQLSHDAPDPSLALTIAGHGGEHVFEARLPEEAYGVPDFLRHFAVGAASGLLTRALGLPGMVIGAGLAYQLRRGGTPATATLDDPTVTLAAEDGALRLRTTVPSAEVEPTHLREFLCTVLEATRPRRGTTVTVSRFPQGRWQDGEQAEAVRLRDVGGLTEVVEQFRDVAVSFQHPEVMARWGATRPQGILLYGPPGTGKTMLARALANEIGAQLKEIRTPEILSKWVGESEKRIKRVFDEARRYREPTILLFDEFDSIISYTGASTDAASQMVNAMAGIFKQEMNTLIESNPNVIVVATTNFPERVDASLVRSGRFDLKLAVPPPDAAARADILAKAIRQLIFEHEVPGFRMFDEDLDVAELAALSIGMTGADLKEVLRRVQLDKAMLEARSGAPAGPIGQDDLRRGIARMRRP